MKKYKRLLKIGKIDEKEFIAIERYLNGENINCSCFIDEVTLTIGYGKLGDMGDFQYELPYFFRKEHNIYGGCRTWKEYHKYVENKKREEKLNRILK